MMTKYKKVLLAANLLLAVTSTSAQNGTSGLPSQLSSSYSYVLSRTITQTDGKKSLDHVDYDNGLGQTYQKVDVAMAKNGADLVSLMEYDGYGRPLRSWLPGLGSGGACVNASTLKQSAKSLANDDAPYTWTVYEKSPLDRLSEEYQPGNDWHQHGKKQEYTYNRNANSILEIVIEGSQLYIYKSRKYTALYPKEVRDEAGVLHIEYQDADGRVVAKSDKPSNNDYEHITYYVYDDAGQLRFVLPPEAYYQIYTDYKNTTAVISPSYDALLKYGYEYRYDGRGNCIYKRLPGCDPVYYIYDKAGRCIFSQDGVQRTKSPAQWSYTVPDVFGRTAITGTCTNSLSYTSEPLKSVVVTASRVSSGGTYGYSISGVSISGNAVYTVSYYDDYDFIGKNGVPSQLAYATPPSGYTSRGLMAPRGLATGAITARLSSSGVSGYDYSAVYYDDRGRVIQTRTTNHLGGYDYEYSCLSYVDNVEKRQHVHSASGKATQTETYTYTYDSAQRLITTKYKLNSNSEITLKSNVYDDLGRLESSTQNGSLTTGYSYNVRSWLKSITTGALFSESLYYNESHGGNTPDYRGNISAMEWNADGKSRAYNFTYDYHSRLKKAVYLEGGSANGHYDTEYTYDRMGNFKTLKRSGKQDGGKYGPIDNLTFTYSGNQVTKIDDSVTDPTYSGVFNFMDGASQANEYTYDKNGNLTKDLNKKISSIQYNLLNLPASITYSTPNIVKSATYVYDATGKKLRVTYTNPNSTTDYCGNMIYENNVLKQILVDGGYVTFSGSTPQYHFYLKDHLGNNRVVVNANGTKEQVDHYYPFGGLFGESTNGDTQRYKYNGKELDRMHGLDWYDYGARHMDGMRFTTIDPLAEKYYNISPYAYCANNPINAKDLKGKKIVFVNGKIGGGSPSAGKSYWNGENSMFVSGAKSFFQDNNVTFTDMDYSYLSSANSRMNEGYEYAKSHFDEWTREMKDDEPFRMVSHSMGGAFSKGIENYIKEQGREVDFNIMINTFQIDKIKNPKESKTFYVDYQNTNDPVLFWFDPNLGRGELENSNLKIRERSEEGLKYIHRDPIDSGSFWNKLKSEIDKYLKNE